MAGVTPETVLRDLNLDSSLLLPPAQLPVRRSADVPIGTPLASLVPPSRPVRPFQPQAAAEPRKADVAASRGPWIVPRGEPTPAAPPVSLSQFGLNVLPQSGFLHAAKASAAMLLARGKGAQPAVPAPPAGKVDATLQGPNVTPQPEVGVGPPGTAAGPTAPEDLTTPAIVPTSALVSAREQPETLAAAHMEATGLDSST